MVGLLSQLFPRRMRSAELWNQYISSPQYKFYNPVHAPATKLDAWRTQGHRPTRFNSLLPPPPALGECIHVSLAITALA